MPVAAPGRVWGAEDMPNGDQQLDDARDGAEPESVARRNLLRMGGIAAAGAAAAVVATAVNATPAGADPAYMQLGVVNDTGTEFTVLKSAQPQGIPTLLVGGENPNQGIGLYAYGIGAGVMASTRGYGAALDAGDQGSYVPGSGTGPAVLAHLENTNNGSPAVIATTMGGGKAIDARIEHATNSNPCIAAETAGTGPAVRAVGRPVLGQSDVGAGNGAALDVRGTTTFSRTGVVTIAAGLSSALTALVPGGLFGASHVLATLQTNAGAVGVRSAVPILSGAGKGKIHVYLTAKAPAGGVKVAWLVFG